MVVILLCMFLWSTFTWDEHWVVFKFTHLEGLLLHFAPTLAPRYVYTLLYIHTIIVFSSSSCWNELINSVSASLSEISMCLKYEAEGNICLSSVQRIPEMFLKTDQCSKRLWRLMLKHKIVWDGWEILCLYKYTYSGIEILNKPFIL